MVAQGCDSAGHASFSAQLIVNLSCSGGAAMRRIVRGLWIVLVATVLAYGAMILSEVAGLTLARLAE
jgi:hypothetical protein